MQADQLRNYEAKRRFNSNAKGFSMVELLLVVMMGLILTAISIPQVKSVMNRYRLQGCGRQF